ncbi:TPA: restriction endonuclease subunit S [Photobacterium damselae]
MVPSSELSRLGEVTSLITKGATPTTYGYQFVEEAQSQAAFIGAYNCTFEGNLKLDTKKWISKEANESLKRSKLQAGDSILCIVGNTIGSSFLVDESILPANINQNVALIRPIKERLSSLYLKHAICSSFIQWQVKMEASIQAQPSLSLKQVGDFKIFTPPLPEQRKIAQILSTWDRGIATTEKLIDASKQQKKALMQQLLTGKKRLVDPETGKAFEGEWEEVKLGEICDVKGGKRLPKGESLQEHPNAFPYIRVADMHMGGVDLSNLLYVPVQIAPSIKNYTITSKDLFITVAGTLGLVGKIPKELDGANLTENADKLTNITCNQVFLMYVLMSPIIQKHIDAESTQNAQPKLALTRIRGFSFNLPANNEQKRIASVLTAADKDIELLEAKLAYLKQEKKALMQQLLTGKRRVSLSS